MTRNMKTITSGVVMNILATDPRPSDGADEAAAQAAEGK